MIYPINWAHSWPYIATAFFAAYMLGAIPFGLLLTRMAGLGDVRNIGSGNIGATNVLRTGNKALAAATLLLDGGKGALAVLVGWQVGGPDIAIVAAAGSVLGHLFPVWLKFKGGKGVATGLGVLLALSWPVGLAACATWIATAALFRFSSLAALVAVAATPFYAWFFADPQRAEFAAALAIVIWLKHAGNIKRLLTGQESRIGKKS
jgi:acyl phosphate:glycerol-3-phosphate acyltransferase